MIVFIIILYILSVILEGYLLITDDFSVKNLFQASILCLCMIPITPLIFFYNRKVTKIDRWTFFMGGYLIILLLTVTLIIYYAYI